ncbi:SLOG family protein [Streptomyces scabiei]|uniref:SLOG family protein n=1 Tax=Streptomyces scabiei TaxID=1930 RepID=UPI0038F5E6A1
MTNPYRILVTGSRDWRDEELIRHQLTRVWLTVDRPFVVVHGACPTGADWMASDWAANMLEAEMGDVREEPHPAQNHPTEDFGPWPEAGPRRNTHMVKLGADLAFAFIGPCTSPRCRRPDPHPSHGASHCAHLAEAAGIPTKRYTA